MSELTITKNNFEAEVLNADIPVLLDFWAPWCGPCRMIAPAVAQVAQENAGKLKVGKVNVDEEVELAMRYGIASIPTLLVFQKGRLAGKSVGLISKDRIEALVKEAK